MMPVPVLLAFGCAAVLAFLLTPLSSRVALALGAVDKPEARKLHVVPVPRLGGLAVGAAVLATLLPAVGLTNSLTFDPGGLGVAVAAAVILLVGAIDDARGLRARTKLLVEFAAAGLVMLLLVGRGGAPLLSHLTVPGWLGLGMGALWIVAITNAFNMLDVADGIAAGVGAITAFAIGLISAANGHAATAIAMAATSGGLAGFLPHNLSRGRTFLGDSGSLFAGFALGVSSLVGLRSGSGLLVVPAVLILGLPFAELTLTVLRRLLRALTIERASALRGRFTVRAGAPGLFVADRRHIPHRMLELGFGHTAMLVTVYTISAGLGLLAWLTARSPGTAPIAATVVGAGVLYAAPRWLYEELRILDRGAFLPLLETRLLHNRFTHLVFDGSATAVSLVVAVGLIAPGRLAALSRWPGLALLVGVTLAGCKLAGLYRGSYRSAGLPETARAVRAVIVGSVIGLLAMQVFLGARIPIGAWILHTYLMLTILVGARLSFRVLEFVHARNGFADEPARATAHDDSAAAHGRVRRIDDGITLLREGGKE